MNILTCKNVSFAYDNGIVLDDVNFSVQQEDYLCIVGENGSGKSTLMKGLLGLIKPAEGRITMEHSLHQNEIGYLPQQTVAQKDFPASVYEVVLSGRLNSRGLRPFYTKEDKDQANSAIEFFGMQNQKKECYRELSGGQQQRVLLARALCATKKLLLLDEPAAGLDPKATADLYKTINYVNKEKRIAIIMVSHDIENAVKYAKHILHLGGKQLFVGTTQEYIESETGARFLGGAPC